MRQLLHRRRIRARLIGFCSSANAAAVDEACPSYDVTAIAADLLEKTAASQVPILAGIAVATMVALVLRLDTSSPLLPLWWAACVLLCGLRLWARARARCGPVPPHRGTLGWQVLVFPAVHGALWGALVFGLAVGHDAHGRELACVVISGLCAGAVANYAAHPPSVDAFAWSANLPIITSAALLGGPHNFVLASLATVFTIAVSLYARRAQGWMIAAHQADRVKDRLLAQLAAANTAAEASSRAKSLFLANMSHELRTPLNAIIGYSALLLEDAPPDGDQQLAADLGRINRAGQHLLSLVNDVLDLSKIEAGRMELTMGPFELRDCIEDLAAACRWQIEANGSRFDVEFGTGLGVICTDATKLRQVVLNLLSNAGKFTRDGCVTLTVTRERRDAVDWIVASVRDTGIGIDADGLSRLFAEFTQAEARTAAMFGGTGLGLALSRNLCRLMGGDITVESQPGVGSCFTIRVPSLPQAACDGDFDAPAAAGRKTEGYATVSADA